MRTLRFIVEDQIIKQDPNCDFDGLVPGTNGYLEAEFSFSPQWDGCVKAAGFYSPMGREIGASVLVGGTTCTVPFEALKFQAFKIRIVGKKGDLKLVTDKVTVTQNGGNS
jgi:hypothetical protein